MNILICANQDLYANILLNHLLPRISNHQVSVLFSTRIGSQKKRSPVLDYLKFFEQELPNQFHFPHCEAQTETQNEGNRLKTFRQLSQRYGIEMQPIANINQPEGLAQVRALAPDLIISVRFGQILKENVIQIPRLGVINLHSGLLPEYRGVLATFWSLLYGSGEYGYTLHRITDAGIDTGDMIERRVMATHPNRSLFCHIQSIYPPAARSIAQAIQTLENGQALPSQAQLNAQSAYYSYPETEHFEQFQAKGYSLLDQSAYFNLLREYQCPPASQSPLTEHLPVTALSVSMENEKQAEHLRDELMPEAFTQS